MKILYLTWFSLLAISFPNWGVIQVVFNAYIYKWTIKGKYSEYLGPGQHIGLPS